jgi:hypothetical protein
MGGNPRAARIGWSQRDQHHLNVAAEWMQPLQSCLICGDGFPG